MITMMQPPPRFLTFDEETEFTVFNVPFQTRIRVWQAKDMVPIVLASQMAFSPAIMTTKIANYANVALLGYPEDMAYFEDVVGAHGDRKLNVVHFTKYGMLQRSHYVAVERREFGWAKLAFLLGVKPSDIRQS